MSWLGIYLWTSSYTSITILLADKKKIKPWLDEKVTYPTRMFKAMQDTQKMDYLHGTSGSTSCKEVLLVSVKKNTKLHY